MANLNITCPECNYIIPDNIYGVWTCIDCHTVLVLRYNEVKQAKTVEVKPTVSTYHPLPKLGIVTKTLTDKEAVIGSYCINCCVLLDNLKSVRARVLKGYHPVHRYPLIKSGRACLPCIPKLMELGREWGIETVLPDMFNGGTLTEFRTSERADHTTIGFGHVYEDDTDEVDTDSTKLSVKDKRKLALEIARSKKPAIAS